MLEDLKKRFSVSIVLISAIIVLLMFSAVPIMKYIFCGLVAILSAIASWEYVQFAKAIGGKPQSAALITLSFFVTISFLFSVPPFEIRLMPQTAFLVSVLVLFALHFHEKTNAVIDLAVSTFGLLYISLPLGMIIGILYLPMVDDGRMWVAYLLAVTKITDMGAYFGGSLWGKRKLAPHISPAKTIEGAIFGLVSALLVSFLFHLLGEKIPALHFHLSTAEWVTLGIVLGCVGQFGDLSESLLKRDANKKDSNMLPGLGGVLDSVDSLLFNAPIIYFYSLVARSLSL